MARVRAEKGVTVRFIRLLFPLLTVALAAIVGLAPAAAQVGRGSPPEWAFGQRAVDVLGDRLPDTARAYGLSPGQLNRMFLDDPTLAVDRRGELLYADELAPGEEAIEASAGELTAAAPPTTDPVFALSSRPGADHTIYLDFDGHTASGTTWNSGATIVSPPYDIDSAPETWSTTELNRIRATFLAVAEDFAPFDVNVTTAEPSQDELTRSGSGDATWGVRVVFSRDTAFSCGCGGIAYIGSFDDVVDEPVYVFNTSLTGLIEAASHEVGHAMGLSHDGTSERGYYGGHGSGETSWGPIMGAAYNKNVTQWSQGDYFDSNNAGSGANYNRGPDDLAVISSLTNGNGFGYRVDDHGDTAMDATVVATSGSRSGVIETTDDVDVFVVTTSGGLAVAADPVDANPNLDIKLEITTAGGDVVVVSSPSSSLRAAIDRPDLAAGTYLVRVDGTGWGDPLTSGPTGWVEYGSLGQYTVDITLTDAPPDTEPPAAPTGLTVSDVRVDGIDLTWAANTESDLAGYDVERSTSAIGPFTVIATPANVGHSDATVADGTTYHYRVVARDLAGNRSTSSDVVSATTPDAPVVPDLAVSVSGPYGAVSGVVADTAALDGAVQTLSEQSSGGRKSSRFDRADQVWRIPVSDGNHLLRLVAQVTDGGDADTGFELSWSSNASGPWVALDTLVGGVDAAYDLGAPVGDVYVRVVDTDRTARNVSLDRIAIDLMHIEGGEPPTEPPVAPSGPTPADGAHGVAADTTLAWAPAAGASSYEVSVWVDGVEVASGTTSMTSLPVTGLVPGTVHTWQVTAVNALGETAGSLWSFTTAEPATTMTVSSVVETTRNAGKGRQQAVVTVTVVDGNGAPVEGATVEIAVSGGLNETLAGVTDRNGAVVLVSGGAVKRLAYDACVVSLGGTDLTPAPSVFDC